MSEKEGKKKKKGFLNEINANISPRWSQIN